MAEYVREEILIEHSFDRKRCRHEIGGMTAVLHCHHFATLISRLANDCKLVDAKRILADCAEDAFHAALSNYFKRHGVSGIERRASLAEQYFSTVGLGMMRVKYAGYCSGEVIMEHSHVDEGWLKKWGEANSPVNHIGRGYVTAAFSAIFDRGRRIYFATERRSIARGASQSVIRVTDAHCAGDGAA
jgi:hypothetical protein